MEKVPHQVLYEPTKKVRYRFTSKPIYRAFFEEEKCSLYADTQCTEVLNVAGSTVRSITACTVAMTSMWTTLKMSVRLRVTVW